LNNCVVYFNQAPTNANYLNGALNYCCTLPLPDGDTRSITNEPLFVDQAGGDFRLQTNSPCINAGNNALVVGTTGLDGLPRIVGGTVDIGAYEFQTPASVLPYAWLQQYGLRTDGSADYADSDGDHLNNSQEFLAGTNPMNASSVLQILASSSTNSPSGFTVTWQSVSGRSYFVQRSLNLAAQDGFATVGTNIVGQVDSTSYTDATAVGGGPYFYRVGVQ
jgi:hypothetical protein